MRLSQIAIGFFLFMGSAIAQPEKVYRLIAYKYMHDRYHMWPFPVHMEVGLETSQIPVYIDFNSHRIQLSGPNPIDIDLVKRHKPKKDKDGNMAYPFSAIDNKGNSVYLTFWVIKDTAAIKSGLVAALDIFYRSETSSYYWLKQGTFKIRP